MAPGEPSKLAKTCRAIAKSRSLCSPIHIVFGPGGPSCFLPSQATISTIFPKAGGFSYWPAFYYGYAFGLWCYFHWTSRCIYVDVHKKPRYVKHDRWEKGHARWHHSREHRKGFSYRRGHVRRGDDRGVRYSRDGYGKSRDAYDRNYHKGGKRAESRESIDRREATSRGSAVGRRHGQTSDHKSGSANDGQFMEMVECKQKIVGIMALSNLDRAIETLERLYSPAPRKEPRNPVCMLRSLLLMTLLQFSSIDKWVSETRFISLYAILGLVLKSAIR